MLTTVIKKQGFWHVIIIVIMLLITFGVSARVVYVYVAQSEFLKREGERQYKRNIPQYAYRGNILDATGRELAVSVPSMTIWADPSDLLEDTHGLMNIAKLTGLDYNTLKWRAEKLRHKDFMYIKRQVDPVKARMVVSKTDHLVSVINEWKRSYPEKGVFSHIVGVTDTDGKGVEGVELAFDSHLKRTNGEVSVIRDRLNRRLETVERTKIKKDGGDITLSIDRNIQYISYSELHAAVIRHEARSGMLVVLDVKRGKVLSIANVPAYNPNNRRSSGMINIRNRAITDIFEPGSSIKPFIVAAALETTNLRHTDIINVSPGYISLTDKKITDGRNHGQLDVTAVLAKSSNVGMVKIASMIDDTALAEKLRDYGLFALSGVELRGESAGLFMPQPEWESNYKHFLSFGYGAALTAMQLANSYMMLANKGVRKSVSILNDSDTGPGIKVMSPEVATIVLDMLRSVVSVKGTGVAANTKAYNVAGKTGTSEKLKDGVYQDDTHLTIFTGIAPITNPEIVVAVVIDSPRRNGLHGGQVASPVFSKVTSRILRYLGVKPDVEKVASI